jgi:predicted DNA-binding mobile mystery protein A
MGWCRVGVGRKREKEAENGLILVFFGCFCAEFSMVFLPLKQRSEIRNEETEGKDERRVGMLEKERKLARKKLDMEMRSYRRAGLEKNPTSGLLRMVRQVVGIPVAEIAEKMGVNRSGIFELELNESEGSVTMRSMARMAEAMGCKLVYGIVPEGGKTLEQLAEQRLWAEVFGLGAAGQRVGKTASQQVSSQPASELDGISS